MKVSDLYLIRKDKFVPFCFGCGIFLAYIGSLNPSFLWKLSSLYVLPAAFLAGTSVFVAQSMKEPAVFTRNDYLLPVSVCVVLVFYMSFATGGNVNRYIAQVFHIIVFASLFMANGVTLFKLSTWISKAMACLLIVSILFYLLYLSGFPLPSRNAQFGDMYYYTDYYFFLLDDRSLFIFPRFHSVFLEPGHLGTVTILLLLSQIGHWRKWYNVVLWVTTLMTFSLAAYVLSIVVVSLNLWIHRRLALKKLCVVICFLSAVTAGAFFYNGGDNLVHDLILLRLEVNDEGQLEGDNRVTGSFEDEYDSFLHSSDILFGRDYDYEIPGNSGYRVFIYEYGLMGLFLLLAFFAFSMRNAEDKRVLCSAAIVALLCFLVRGNSFLFCNFVPLFITVNTPAAYLGIDEERE